VHTSEKFWEFSVRSKAFYRSPGIK